MLWLALAAALSCLLAASQSAERIVEAGEFVAAAQVLKSKLAVLTPPALQGRGIIIPAGGDELLTNAMVIIEVLAGEFAPAHCSYQECNSLACRCCTTTSNAGCLS